MEYPGMCFDHVWGLDVHDGVKDILKYAGVEFESHNVEYHVCKQEFFELLTSWHDRALINPMKDEV